MPEAIKAQLNFQDTEATDRSKDIDMLVESLRETVRLMAQGEPVAVETVAA